MQNNQPLDRGRVVYIAETYPTKQVDQQTRQPITKNRYAPVGRATKWANQQGESIEFELDTVPIGHQGPLKLFVFWDSQNNNQQQPQQYQQQSGYQHQSQHAPQYQQR
jgi:hypothetical protein